MAVDAYLKESVKNYWDAAPCGTRDIAFQEGTREFFDLLERRRYRLEAFIDYFANFESFGGKRVLEVGCGPGVDLVRFARGGAKVSGVDLSPRSVALAREWLSMNELAAEVKIGDAENLPFENLQFDFVYSWGVLHHTPNTERAIQEIRRVLKQGGRFCVMLYHKPSVVTLQAWLVHGLLAGNPRQSIDDILAAHVESPGTKALTILQVKELFADFTQADIETVVTPYDTRLGRRLFLPGWFRHFVPKRLGWFLVVQGRK